MSVSRQYKWQLKQLYAGKCKTCGRDRGDDGTTNYCRIHADDYNAIHRRRRQKLKTKVKKTEVKNASETSQG